MMSAAWICLVLAVGAEGPEPSELVERLGASSPSGRDEAAEALEGLGASALPALRAARGGPDPNRARRAAALIEEIGRRRLLRPTTVAPDLDNQPIEDAVAALRRASGFAVALVPEGDPRWRDRRAGLRAPGGMPFWEALDRVAEAGQARLDTAPPRNWQGPAIRLVPRDEKDEGEIARAYAGPYRLSLGGPEAGPKGGATATATARLAFRVAAEPGIVIERNGPVRVLEATDERGRALRADPAAGRPQPSNRAAGRFDPEHLSILTESIALGRPEGKIKRLRGYVPIVAVARAGRVLSFSARGAEGRTFSAGGVRVTVVRFGVDRGVPTPLQLRVEPSPEPALPAFAPGPNRRSLGPTRLPYDVRDHVQLTDAQGKPAGTAIAWGPAAPAPADDGAGAYLLTVRLPTGQAPPEVAYHDLAAVATEVPFDFADLALP